MSDHSAIEWTNATWNPIAGCTRVSAGCDNCYAATLAAGRLKNTRTQQGLAVVTPSGRAAFNGTIRLLPDRLDQPLRWREPRRIFVNSMSDLFHELVPNEFIDRAFAVMALAQHHTFQVLTKRPARMLAYLTDETLSAPGGTLCAGVGERIARAMFDIDADADDTTWPLPNCWLGVSVEDQKNADERIPPLLETPAAVRFLSCEPLLGPIKIPMSLRNHLGHYGRCTDSCTSVDWVIAGGESGGGFRRMDPAWALSPRDQCQAAGVPFFFKQWGGRTPKAGGRELDGRIWDEMPQRVTA